jgi:2-phosphosulfolactate phosphatase
MSFFSQQPFDIRLEWGSHAVELLAQDVDCIIIVDVMSFSSCVSLAAGRGARIYPYPWKDTSAEAYADRLGAVTASGTRRFAGQGYSLSPASLANIAPGTKLVLPSPNGSALAFSARDSGAAVFCGGLRNLSATAASCKAYSRILVVAGGERWPDGSLRPALEDWLAAGGIVSLLSGRTPSPEAQAAAAAYRALEPSALKQCSSARELIERGFSADVDLCLAVDADESACRLRGDHFIRV